MKFDLHLDGVDHTRRQADVQREDLDADLKTLLAGIGEAAEAAPGPLASAVSSLDRWVRDTIRRPINNRLASLILGSGDAVGAYDDADRQMATDTRAAQAEVPGIGVFRILSRQG